MDSDKEQRDDTIVAIATFPAAAAVGIVKLSGCAALRIVSQIFVPRHPKDLKKVPTYTVHYGWIVEKIAKVSVQKKTKTARTAPVDALDEVLVIVMRAPHSHTAEDVVEIQAHAGAYVLDRIVRLCCAHGARVAMPGEFSRRAFLNGRIDFVQAEGALDVIAAGGEEALRLGMAQVSGRLSAAIAELEETLERAHAHLEAEMSFPEEAAVDTVSAKKDLALARETLGRLLAHAQKARLYRDGLRCVICGRPNAGKSSLLNMLLEEERVIVSPIAGTTRDVVEERVMVRGIPLVIADTAGILKPRDEIEEQAVARSLAKIDDADIILFVLDASLPLDPSDRDILARAEGKAVVVILNKSDLNACVTATTLAAYGFSSVSVSAKTHGGLAELEEAIVLASKAGALPKGQELFVSNQRHIALLTQAKDDLDRARELLVSAPDRALFHVRDARDGVRAVLGRAAYGDILETVFSHFCIWK